MTSHDVDRFYTVMKAYLQQVLRVYSIDRKTSNSLTKLIQQVDQEAGRARRKKTSI